MHISLFCLNLMISEKRVLHRAVFQKESYNKSYASFSKNDLDHDLDNRNLDHDLEDVPIYTGHSLFITTKHIVNHCSVIVSSQSTYIWIRII